MGRHKKYDSAIILEKGIALFRKKGYHHTSSEDIVQELEIPKGTFYGMYKTKEHFGVQVLEQYVENTLSYMQKMLYQNEDTSPLSRLKSFYESLADYFTSEGCSYGCLLNNFSLELAGYNDAMRDTIEKGHQKFILKIEPCVKEAQEKGEIRSDIPPHELTYFIHSSFDGAIVKMKGVRNDLALQIFLSTIFQLLKG